MIYQTQQPDGSWRDQNEHDYRHSTSHGYNTRILSGGRVDSALERDLLRTVYEHARSFLRYNGIDRGKVNAAVDLLDQAIEDVKQFGGGTYDPPEAEPVAEPVGAELLKRVWDVLDGLEYVKLEYAMPSRVEKLKRAAERFHAAQPAPEHAQGGAGKVCEWRYVGRIACKSGCGVIFHSEDLLADKDCPNCGNKLVEVKS